MARPARTSLRSVFARISLVVAAAVMAAALVLASAVPAQANSRYAALVMNADTGDVIYSRNADLRRYPASLTKLMTLYLLFEAIEEGRLELDDELHVSSRAAGQPPSKLGVETGSTITVDDAIQALVVRSANDVAVVVAEALADREWRFAQRMTQRAGEMGMNLTRFENASGLPHQRQRSTARDLSILAMRIASDFPQHMHYFSQESFTYNGRTWRSHNSLLEDYDGTTGLKTGYTRASGFNLIATVERDGISLVGIVLGGRTAARRDREMERILDLNFTRLRENPFFGSRVFSSNVRPMLRPSPGEPATVTVMASLAPSAAPAMRPDPAIPEEFENMPMPALHPDSNREPLTRAGAEVNDLAALAASGTDPGLGTNGGEHQRVGMGAQIAANGSAIPAGDIDPAYPTGWGIEVGEFLSPELADRRLQSVAATAPTQLTWGMAALLPSEGAEQVSFTAGFGPMSQDEAVSVCASLAQTGYACQPINSVDWNLAVRR